MEPPAMFPKIKGASKKELVPGMKKKGAGVQELQKNANTMYRKGWGK